MKEKEFFIKKHYNDITAATIGISKVDWFCYEPGMSQKKIAETMLSKNYDIVSIVNKLGVCAGYFTLNEVDNTKLDSYKIDATDSIYYLTHISDVIWKMNENKKKFLFLTNGQKENLIVGLLSLSNFNSREFYIYLYSIISYVEREFATLIKSKKNEGFLILDKRNQTIESTEQLKEIQKRICEDEKNNIENDYKEYLYLHHLIWLITDEGEYKRLNYTKSQKFEDGTKTLKDLRNYIAHPVKSLVRNSSDLKELEHGMNKLYELKDRIENYLEKRVSDV